MFMVWPRRFIFNGFQDGRTEIFPFKKITKLCKSTAQMTNGAAFKGDLYVIQIKQKNQLKKNKI